jgi:hypothetical protein
MYSNNLRHYPEKDIYTNSVPCHIITQYGRYTLKVGLALLEQKPINPLAGKVLFSDVKKRVQMADTATRQQHVSDILDGMLPTLC